MNPFKTSPLLPVLFFISFFLSSCSTTQTVENFSDQPGSVKLPAAVLSYELNVKDFLSEEVHCFLDMKNKENTKYRLNLLLGKQKALFNLPSGKYKISGLICNDVVKFRANFAEFTLGNERMSFLGHLYLDVSKTEAGQWKHSTGDKNEIIQFLSKLPTNIQNKVYSGFNDQKVTLDMIKDSLTTSYKIDYTADGTMVERVKKFVDDIHPEGCYLIERKTNPLRVGKILFHFKVKNGLVKTHAISNFPHAYNPDFIQCLEKTVLSLKPSPSDVYQFRIEI